MQNLQTIDEGLADLAGLQTIDAPAASTAPAAPTLQHQRRVERRRFCVADELAKTEQSLGKLPGRRQALHGVITGAISGWRLCQAIIHKLQPARVAELTIATLGFNRENAAQLCESLDANQVQQVLLLVSDYFRSTDRTVFADIRRDLESRGQRVLIARSHAKLALFRATDGRCLVLETSANLRSSKNWEQFCLCDDPELLEFHRRWIEQLTADL